MGTDKGFSVDKKGLTNWLETE